MSKGKYKMVLPTGEFLATKREKELYEYMLERKNQTLDRYDILEALWGKRDYFLGRSLDVFVSRIRKRLSGQNKIEIVTVRNVGFILCDNDPF